MSGYRSAAFAAYPNECDRCTHKGTPSNRLVVHHRDENRSHHELTNLQILCRSCHGVVHRKDAYEAVTQMGVALYPQDVESVRAIQAHHKLDSFSQAVRRAIRDTVETLNGSTESERAA